MKQFFTLFYACLFSLTGAFVLTGCTSSGDDDNDGSGTPKPVSPIETSQPSISFSDEISSDEFTIKANADWTITITETRSVSWCDVYPTSGRKGETIVVTVTTQPNDTYDDRSANITIAAGTATKVITVSQRRKEALTVTSQKVNVGNGGDKIIVEVKHSMDLTAAVRASDASWIKEVTTRALSTTKKEYTVSANTGMESREGWILLSAGELKDTVRIYQTAADKLILTDNTTHVPVEGGTFDVELRTNVDYTVNIINDEPWISLAKTGSLNRVDRYRLEVEPNAGHDERMARVAFADRHSTLADTLYVYQAGTGDPGIVMADAAFHALCLANFDTDGDGRLSTEEAQAVKSIEIPMINYRVTTTRIRSLEGIEYFTELEELVTCNYNVELVPYVYLADSKLDFNQNTKLKKLVFGIATAEAIELDLTANTALEHLELIRGDYSEVILESKPKLTHILISCYTPTSLDASRCPELRVARVDDFYFDGDLDLSGSIKLDTLDIVAGRPIFPAQTALKWLSTDYSGLDLSCLPELTTLHYYGDADLDFQQCPNLEELYCGSLTQLNMQNLKKLKKVYAPGKATLKTAEFRSIDFSGCTALEEIDLRGKVTGKNGTTLTSAPVNLTGCKALKTVRITEYETESLDFSNCRSLEKLEIAYVKDLDLSGCSALTYVRAYEYGGGGSIVLRGNDTYSANTYDLSGCTSLKEAIFPYTRFESLNLASCTSLEKLKISQFQAASPDLSACGKLQYFEGSLGGDLDFTPNQELRKLTLFRNAETYDRPEAGKIESINLTACSKLDSLYIESYAGAELNLSGNARLSYLYLNGATKSKLQSLDLSANAQLKYLELYYAGVESFYPDLTLPSSSATLETMKLFWINSTSLGAMNYPALKHLEVEYLDNLQSLSLTNCTALDRLYVYHSFSMGVLSFDLDISTCRNLSYLFLAFYENGTPTVWVGSDWTIYRPSNCYPAYNNAIYKVKP